MCDDKLKCIFIGYDNGLMWCMLFDIEIDMVNENKYIIINDKVVKLPEQWVMKKDNLCMV